MACARCAQCGDYLGNDEWTLEDNGGHFELIHSKCKNDFEDYLKEIGLK
jgi:hypothetical protein